MLNTAVSSQKAAFAVFDADHVATYGGFGDFNYGSGISEGDFAKECENSPAVFVDDTLEGLAAQMGIDTTAFTTTIAEYNDHAATGTDADSFGTMPGEKTPVLKAPFYAAKIVACAYGTNGGRQHRLLGAAPSIPMAISSRDSMRPDRTTAQCTSTTIPMD